MYKNNMMYAILLLSAFTVMSSYGASRNGEGEDCSSFSMPKWAKPVGYGLVTNLGRFGTQKAATYLLGDKSYKYKGVTLLNTTIVNSAVTAALVSLTNNLIANKHEHSSKRRKDGMQIGKEFAAELTAGAVSGGVQEAYNEAIYNRYSEKLERNIFLRALAYAVGFAIGNTVHVGVRAGIQRKLPTWHELFRFAVTFEDGAIKPGSPS